MYRDIRKELGKRILFFDGAMGTLLQEQGLEPGELPETWNLAHPDKLKTIHKAYLEAGADIILANTFGANSIKFGDELEKIVEAGVGIAREAVQESAPDRGYVALDIGSLGKLLRPLGTLDFEEAVSIFARTIRAGERAGADLILIETMSDTYELKAAVLAAKENSALPVMATVIFGENAKMLTGATPEAVTALLEGLGVDAIGMNCGLGPKQMMPIFDRMAACASVPLIINPNAGLPRSDGKRTVYDVSADEFAEDMVKLVKAGAWLVGGCCGTTPEFIRELTKSCRSLKPVPITDKNLTVVSSYSHAVELGRASVIIGERINPTGKAKFKQALRNHNMEYILEAGVKQTDAGAHILDVNVGLPEIDEPAMMKDVVFELQSILDAPLQIDTTNMQAMENALRIYNGKPMINSVNGKQEIMEQIFPLAKKYGGVVVGLALDEGGIPKTSEGRLAVAKKIYETAEKYGIARKNIVIDALTMTMSTDSSSAKVTLDTVKSLTAMGCRSVLGVSNISFGLPQRELINSSFYTMALNAGLSAAIINPNAALMRQAYDAYMVLGGYDDQCLSYVEKYSVTEAAAPIRTGGLAKQKSGGAGSAGADGSAARSGNDMDLRTCIVKGFKDQAYKATKKQLEAVDPMEVINNQLVPALDEVGKGFEKGTMFLPQLLMSAEAAKSGFKAVKEFIDASGGVREKKATFVIATVKGDIHDIGKNIVKVLLENYGYDVIDLGKDVAPELIAETVVKNHAPILGLSALMTTTVVNMEETIKQVRAAAPWCKIVVGGAVLTKEYAEKIGADYYGKDAMQTVYYAEKLTSERTSERQ